MFGWSFAVSSLAARLLAVPYPLALGLVVEWAWRCSCRPISFIPKEDSLTSKTVAASSEGSELPICCACGVQYGHARSSCPICEDERQYVRWDGQSWTTLAQMRAGKYTGKVEQEGPGVFGIGSTPSFAIGQRGLLVISPNGNVLWDCIPYLDDYVVSRVNELGGISAIAISHPHFYGSMVQWSKAFDAPIYIHAADSPWIPRPDPSIVLWEGEKMGLAPGFTLINAGIHFRGGTVLHWSGAPGGQGALLSGDIFQVVMDRRWVSFMYSYPNLIPERPSTVRNGLRLLEPFNYERIYGAFWGRIVESDGAAAVARSAQRYLDRLIDDPRLTGPSGQL